MRVKCKNCLPKEGIEIPDFSINERKTIVKLKQLSPLLLIKHLIEKSNLTALEAKYVTKHVNLHFGHCNCCQYIDLEEGIVDCPKCKALNFNW